MHRAHYPRTCAVVHGVELGEFGEFALLRRRRASLAHHDHRHEQQQHQQRKERRQPAHHGPSPAPPVLRLVRRIFQGIFRRAGAIAAHTIRRRRGGGELNHATAARTVGGAGEGASDREGAIGARGGGDVDGGGDKCHDRAASARGSIHRLQQHVVLALRLGVQRCRNDNRGRAGGDGKGQRRVPGAACTDNGGCADGERDGGVARVVHAQIQHHLRVAPPGRITLARVPWEPLPAGGTVTCIQFTPHSSRTRVPPTSNHTRHTGTTHCVHGYSIDQRHHILCLWDAQSHMYAIRSTPTSPTAVDSATPMGLGSVPLNPPSSNTPSVVPGASGAVVEASLSTPTVVSGTPSVDPEAEVPPPTSPAQPKRQMTLPSPSVAVMGPVAVVVVVMVTAGDGGWVPNMCGAPVVGTEVGASVVGVAVVGYVVVGVAVVGASVVGVAVVGYVVGVAVVGDVVVGAAVVGVAVGMRVGARDVGTCVGACVDGTLVGAAVAGSLVGG